MTETFPIEFDRWVLEFNAVIRAAGYGDYMELMQTTPTHDHWPLLNPPTQAVLEGIDFNGCLDEKTLESIRAQIHQHLVGQMDDSVLDQIIALEVYDPLLTITPNYPTTYRLGSNDSGDENACHRNQTAATPQAG